MEAPGGSCKVLDAPADSCGLLEGPGGSWRLLWTPGGSCRVPEDPGAVYFCIPVLILKPCKTNEISSNKKRKHVSGVAERIENVINNSYKGCGNKRKAEELIKLCGYGKIYGDTGKNIIDDFALQVGKKTFPAWKVLKEIDLHNRSANFSTVELLRKVEGVKVYGRGMFTSSSTLSNRCKELETYASTIIPFKEFISVGENLNITFDYEKILAVTLQSLGLYEKTSKDGVEIAFTLDYAQICKRRGHVLAGIKIFDKDARHPSSK